MATIVAQTSTWEEIDRSESYLVCCMFNEAYSLASSVLRRLLENYNRDEKGREILENYEDESDDMLESAGIVLVQSLKQLQRTSEILNDLKLLFGSLTAVPVQVFLTGVCLHMSEGPLTTVRGFLEEFLNNWRYVDGQYYPVSGAESSVSDTEESSFRYCMGVDKYLEVAELYVITLLAVAMKDLDHAISWVEKAMIPLEKRQELLRRLHSMNSSMVTSSSQTSISPLLPDHKYKTKSDILRDHDPCNGHLNNFESGRNTAKEEILKLSRQKAPCFWWFPTINLKFGNTRLIVPTGKIVLASLLLILYFIARKKQAAMTRFFATKALSVKKSLHDLWQLAFSYQVNPLAAVQSLPSATFVSR